MNLAALQEQGRVMGMGDDEPVQIGELPVQGVVCRGGGEEHRHDGQEGRDREPRESRSPSESPQRSCLHRLAAGPWVRANHQGRVVVSISRRGLIVMAGQRKGATEAAP